MPAIVERAANYSRNQKAPRRSVFFSFAYSTSGPKLGQHFPFSLTPQPVWKSDKIQRRRTTGQGRGTSPSLCSMLCLMCASVRVRFTESHVWCDACLCPHDDDDDDEDSIFGTNATFSSIAPHSTDRNIIYFFVDSRSIRTSSFVLLLFRRILIGDSVRPRFSFYAYNASICSFFSLCIVISLFSCLSLLYGWSAKKWLFEWFLVHLRLFVHCVLKYIMVRWGSIYGRISILCILSVVGCYLLTIWDALKTLQFRMRIDVIDFQFYILLKFSSSIDFDRFEKIFGQLHSNFWLITA